LGLAAVLRSGRDLTIATHSYMTRVALKAAERLAEDGIECEVVDLRSLAPLDVATLVTSVRKTGALLTLEEGQVICGVGAEVAAQVQAHLGPIPVRRIGALPAPVSSCPTLEAACIPDAYLVVEQIKAFLQHPSTRRGLSGVDRSRLGLNP
jgi:pyruvate dehydrogenase E1 component beta subunit